MSIYSENWLRSRKITFLGVLTAFAVVLHTIEAGLPNPTPWLRLGLANIITLVALMSLGLGCAMAVQVLRIIIGSLLTGTLFSPVFIQGFGGGMAAAFAMWLVWHYGGRLFSPVGISIIGAFVHTSIQVLLAYLIIIRHFQIFFLLPIFLLTSVATGFFNGLAAYLLFERLSRMGFNQNYS